MLIKAAFYTSVLLIENIESCPICQMKAIEVLMFIGISRIGTCTSLWQHFKSPVSYDEFWRNLKSSIVELGRGF